MSDSKFSAELTAAIEAVRAAGRLTSLVQAALTQAKVRTKSDASPVSVGDYAAQVIVRHLLSRMLGSEVPFVAEESSDALAQESPDFLREVMEVVRMEWPDTDLESILSGVGANLPMEVGASYWTLDPIDGTKGFLRNEHYAIALARIDGGQVTLAVLGCPRLDPSGTSVAPSSKGSILYVERDGPVYIEAMDEKGVSRALAPNFNEPRDSIRVAKSVERDHVDGPRYAHLVNKVGGEVEQVAADGQVKYALLALGLADLYLRVARGGYREKVWDHAAGAFVAQTTGYRASDARGRPLDFGTPPYLANEGGLVVAPPWLHARLMAV